MNVRNTVMGILFGLGVSLGPSAPVLAQTSGLSGDRVEQSSVLQVPVIFKEDYTQSGLSLAEHSVKKYTEGLLVGYGIDDEVKINVNGRILGVRPTSVAISSEEKEILKKDQEKEAEKRNRREEAEAKIRSEGPSRSSKSSDEAVNIDEIEDEDMEVALGSTYEWNGSVLSKGAGVNQGPSGKETYYNLPMQGVISIMRSIGNTDEYWVREDGVKMLGDYVMVAAHLPTRPRGSLVPTSLGMGIVCDTGTFALSNHTQLDIAVDW